MGGMAKMDSFEKSDLNAVLIESLDTLPSGVCVWTEDDRLVFVNKFRRNLSSLFSIAFSNFDKSFLKRLSILRIDCLLYNIISRHILSLIHI